MISKSKKIISLLLTVVCMLTLALPLAPASMPFSGAASAAPKLTSTGLAEHGIKAYNDGWLYNYGSKGEVGSAGKRMSDCSGLIYAYFTDNGTTGPRTVTQQANASVQSGSVSNGIPRIHGLIITIANYNHVGIYLGNGQVVDNSQPGTNMLMGGVYDSNGNARRGWLKWHMMSSNIQYPVSGFYPFNGKMYHYTDRQYDINTTVSNGGTTYQIGNDGVVCDLTGKPIAVNTSMPNMGYASAKAIDFEGSEKPEGDEATVTGSGVNLRSAANTSSSKLGTLSSGTKVYVTETVTGEKITGNGVSSDKWYKLNTRTGLTGYMCSLYVKLDDSNSNETETPSPTPPPTVGNVSTPVISYVGGKVEISSSTADANVYYTTDCKAPTTSSIVYTDPIRVNQSRTYKAIAEKDGVISNTASITVLTNGSFFKDIETNKWYFNAVERSILSNIFNGDNNNNFRPSDYIKRADFVVALANLAKADLSSYDGSTSFSDISKGAYYAKAIAWAEDNNIIGGFDDGTFKPSNNITREQMCLILSTFGNLDKVEHSSTFKDHDTISNWAKDAVYACKHLGIIDGVGDNKFAPKSFTTRAQAATVMVNYNDIK